MANLVLQIAQPAHGTRIAGTDPVRLRAAVTSGSAAGLYFRWFSTLNPAATDTQPELNPSNHSAAILDWTTALDLGSHVITLAATDRDGMDLASVQQMTRGACTGGAPEGGNATPCVVHRYLAVLRAPAAGATLSRASATLEMRAPVRWAKETSKGSGVWVTDTEYQKVNDLRYRFHFDPVWPRDPSSYPPGTPIPTTPPPSADLIPAASALVFFLDPQKKAHLRYQGALPAALGTGPYLMTLRAESLDGTVGHGVQVTVNLA